MMRAPAIFLPHGGGPMPLLNDPGHKELIEFLKGKARTYFNPRPKAIVVVTAHWEETQPRVSSVTTNKLYYDYGGFPPETYNIDFPAKGDPQVAARVVEALRNAGIQAFTDGSRGWDHGVFVPLKLLLEDYETPIVAMSVCLSQDAAEHYKIGKALASLRDEGIAIVGSGMSFHNFAEFRRTWSAPADAKLPTINEPFDDALTAACAIKDADERGKSFAAWDSMPGARNAHPIRQAEHFMPLVVVAGAGGDDTGKKILEWDMRGCKQSAWVW
ncbi:Extradiol ring-cleavage dioxygenase, class III enzyme, subunit B [Powellomyces hirtus]|nr:Extradiol ring-cleavage dioxygenase, class III enzyme, subunit B [Powellomyces hirtus]